MMIISLFSSSFLFWLLLLCVLFFLSSNVMYAHRKLISLCVFLFYFFFFFLFSCCCFFHSAPHTHHAAIHKAHKSRKSLTLPRSNQLDITTLRRGGTFSSWRAMWTSNSPDLISPPPPIFSNICRRRRLHILSLAVEEESSTLTDIYR